MQVLEKAAPSRAAFLFWQDCGEKCLRVRRTRNLLGIPVQGGASNFPQRLLYPQSEVNTNAANVPPADLFTPTPVNATPY
jgi:hypothetical protein